MHRLPPVFLIIILSFFVFVITANISVAGVDKLIVMGTGSPTGVFSRVGKGLCSLVNNKRERHLIRCISYNSAGSVFNVQSVLSNNMDFAMTGSDVAYRVFESRNYSAKKLRLVAILYEMPTAIIVASGMNMKSLEDIAGKAINKGNIGSGKRAVANLIFRKKNWTDLSFSRVLELGSERAGKAFCSGKIQAMIDILGNPSAFYRQIFRNCKGQLISLSEDLIGGFVSSYPYFKSQTINASHYESIQSNIKTFGAEALLVTRSDISERTVYSFLESVYSNIDLYKAIHPALRASKPKLSDLDTMGVPLHSGAKKYFNY